MPDWDPGEARLVRISKLLSLALRHDPTALGLTLGTQGWASVDDVIAGLLRTGIDVGRDELEELVATSDKQRFAISADGAQIRANQGHSIAIDLGLPPAMPPETLLHGTVARFARAIERDGLLRGARTHVHLSEDEATARIVASRRSGAKTFVEVRARAMHDEGFVFLRADNGVWLTEHVPPRFLALRSFGPDPT